MLAQATEAIGGAVKITEQASKYGGDIFVAVLVLLIVVVYVVLVVVPNARSARNQTDKLVEAVSLMSGHVVETHEHAETASNNTGRVVRAMKVQAEIIQRLNDAGPKLPIDDKLGEIRGALS